jgi:hypothetical protein
MLLYLPKELGKFFPVPIASSLIQEAEILLRLGGLTLLLPLSVKAIEEHSIRESRATMKTSDECGPG